MGKIRVAGYSIIFAEGELRILKGNPSKQAKNDPALQYHTFEYIAGTFCVKVFVFKPFIHFKVHIGCFSLLIIEKFDADTENTLFFVLYTNGTEIENQVLYKSSHNKSCP